MNIYSHCLGFLLFVGLTLKVLYFVTHLDTHLVARSRGSEDKSQIELPLDIELAREKPGQWMHSEEALRVILAEHQWRGFLPLCIGAMICLIGSTLYHTLWNVSPSVLRFFARVDYAGIISLSIGHGMLGNHYALYCFPTLVERYNTTILVLSLPVLFLVFYPKFEQPQYRSFRAVVFVSFGLCNTFPVIHAGLHQGFFSTEFWRHAGYFLGTGVLYLVSAFTYAQRWPEKAYPGQFDSYLNSHNILHIGVVLGCLLHFYGALVNFNYRMIAGCSRG